MSFPIRCTEWASSPLPGVGAQYARHTSPALRFLRFVDRNANGCWIWRGELDTKGYGRFHMGGRVEMAHRAAWMLFVGPISDGLFVCHDCPGGDNPGCVNPDHTFLGTPRDNGVDAVRKGRNPNSAKTHCPKGHPYSGVNLRIQGKKNKRVNRVCRTCASARACARKKAIKLAKEGAAVC